MFVMVPSEHETPGCSPEEDAADQQQREREDSQEHRGWSRKKRTAHAAGPNAEIHTAVI